MSLGHAERQVRQPHIGEKLDLGLRLVRIVHSIGAVDFADDGLDLLLDGHVVLVEDVQWDVLGDQVFGGLGRDDDFDDDDDVYEERITDEAGVYVVEEGYDLPSLEEVEARIAARGHLPNMPSAAEVKARGIGLADMSKRLLQQVEELTLHLIAQDKAIRAMQARLQKIEGAE